MDTYGRGVIKCIHRSNKYSPLHFWFRRSGMSCNTRIRHCTVLTAAGHLIVFIKNKFCFTNIN